MNNDIHTPICPVCETDFNFGLNPSMHEVFFTRGYVQTLSAEQRMVIHTGENIVLIHEFNRSKKECHRLAQFREKYKLKCVASLIEIYGLKRIMDFIELVEDMTKIKAFDQRRLIDKVT